MKIRPGSPWLLALGIAVCVLFAAWIAYGQLAPVPVILRTDPAPVALDVRAAPCDAVRYEIACKRWTSHGWPSCTVGATGTEVRELHGGELPRPEHEAGVGVILDEHGAQVGTVLGHGRDHCGPGDLTIEHEIGHLYGLADGGPAGSVMALPFPLAGIVRADDAGTVPQSTRVGPRYPEAP